MSRVASLPASTPLRSRAARVGLVLTGVVSIVSSLLSAAVMYLVFIQPAVAVQALAEQRAGVVVEALASLVLAALLSLVGVS